MKWKFKTLVKFLAMALCSASAWAQVTINPGDILVVDPAAFGGHGAVLRVDPTSGTQTVVSQGGSFSRPTALAIEATGKIVTANRVLPGVVRVDPQTGTQTIVASGSPIIDPFGLALEADGSIVISDMGCVFHGCAPGEPRVPAAVRRINPVSGAVTTVSAGGYLDSPFALTVEANGGILVTDATSGVSPLTGQGGIIRINPVTGAQTIVSQGRLDYGCPFGIAVDASGMILNTVLTFGGYGCAPAAIFRANPTVDQNTPFSPHSMGWSGPFGLAVDTDGSVVVAEEAYQAIFRVNPNTGFPTQISRFGNFVAPTHVAIARPATANVSVTLTGNAATVTAGDGITYTYTITVNNSGPLRASGVTLADSWPSGLARGNTTASQGSCTSGGNFTCSLGDLAANSSATVTVSYTVPSTTPGGPQTHTVSVSSNTPDSNTGNKTSSNTVTVNTSSDLSVTKSDGVTTVTAGDGITRTYTITVSNAGPSAASGVTLADTWPSAFTLGAITASQGSCTSGGNFTCSLGNLATGGSATITASYTVPAATPAGSQTNSASVTSNTPDPNSNNNIASKTTTVNTSADLSVTKSDGVTSVSILDSSTHTYTIVVSNAGPSMASGVTLTDTWPNGFTRGATTTSQGSCTSGSGNFTCSLGNLAPGTSVTVKADYTVPLTSLLSSQTNTVTVSSGTPDPNTGNNKASKTTSVGLL